MILRKRLVKFSETDLENDEVYEKVLDLAEGAGKVGIPLGVAIYAIGNGHLLLPKISKRGKNFFKSYGKDPQVQEILKGARTTGSSVALGSSLVGGLAAYEKSKLKGKKKRDDSASR